MSQAYPAKLADLVCASSLLTTLLMCIGLVEAETVSDHKVVLVQGLKKDGVRSQNQSSYKDLNHVFRSQHKLFLYGTLKILNRNPVHNRRLVRRPETATGAAPTFFYAERIHGITTEHPGMSYAIPN